MIPSLIVQYWDQGDRPYDIESLMSTWKENNSDFEYRLYDRFSAEAFIAEHYDREIAELFRSAALPAMRSDIFRLAFILKHGGVYVDAGTKCLRNISDLISRNDKLVLMRKHHGAIWNGFIAAEKDNTTLQRIWDNVLQNLKSKKIEDVWAATGPGVYNAILNGGYDENGYLILPQSEIRLGWFRIENKLLHKKARHWSKMQVDMDIYAGDDEGGCFKNKKLNTTERDELIFHLGPHKTGTTSFQSLLFDNIKQLEDNGIYVLSVRSDISIYYKAWRVEYTKVLQGYLIGKIKYEVAKSKLVKLLSSVIHDSNIHARTLLFSDENLLGPMPGHHFSGKKGRETGFYTAHKLVFESIKEASGDIPFRIVVCKRDFHSTIISAYKDYVSKLDTNEDFFAFIKFLGGNVIEEYSLFYKGIEKDLGESGYVVPFEDFCKSPDDIFERIIGFRPEVLYSKKENESLSWRAIELAIDICPSSLSQDRRLKLRRFLAEDVVGGSVRLESQVNIFRRNEAIVSKKRGFLLKGCLRIRAAAIILTHIYARRIK